MLGVRKQRWVLFRVECGNIRKSAHHHVQRACKLHRPWVLFRESTVQCIDFQTFIRVVDERVCYERLVATALWLAIWSIRNKIRGETTSMLFFTISAQHHLARMVGTHLSNLPPYTEIEPNVSGSRSQVGSGVARNIELLGYCLCTLPKAVHRGEKNFTLSF